jgi:hypothetical protein
VVQWKNVNGGCTEFSEVRAEEAVARRRRTGWRRLGEWWSADERVSVVGMVFDCRG